MTATQSQVFGYEEALSRRRALAGLVTRFGTVAGDLGQQTWVQALSDLADRVESDSFRVMVLGEFRRGKSTLINAMLGEVVLPSFPWPTTAVINEVRWAEEPYAILHLRDGGGTRRIPVSELEEHVVIDTTDRHAESPYARAEVFWPLDLLRNGVEIIDSPGLNENDVRTEVTLDYLPRADAIVLVLDAQAALSQSEVRCIEQYLGPFEPFFVFNKINLTDPDPVRREKLIRYYREQLRELVSGSPSGSRLDDRSFFVDALTAAAARASGDAPALEASNIPAFEAELERFLSVERGRAKVLRAAREVKLIARDARRLVPQRIRMLEMSQEEIAARYQAAKLPIQGLEQDRELVLARADNLIGQIVLLAERTTRETVRKLADLIPGWLEEFDPRVEFNKIMGNRAKLQEARARVLQHIESRTRTEFAAYLQTTLEPLLDERLADFTRELTEDVAAFDADVDQVLEELSGPGFVDTSTLSADGDASTLERLMAGFGGWLLAGPGGALLGGQFGFRGFVRSMLPQMGMLAGAALVGWNPLTWPVLGVMALVAVFQAQGRLGKAVESFKKKAAEESAAQMRHDAPQIAMRVADSISGQLRGLRVALDEALEARIQSIRDQAESVLAEASAGREAVATQQARLRRSEETLTEIDSELDDLVLAASST